MDNSLKFRSFDFSKEELSQIDKYRKKKNTAVLTIMFTDIEGFTELTEEKGETYVHKLHEQHDKILVNIIEKDQTGIVIKFIGDSIMAVFSEPTSAVEKALLIQESLNEFNESNSESENIKVRIGLHMGQTVIENKMATDLFGRHVNRASRIESLADGGHIYISYSVFDSAKTWLMDSVENDYKFHGNYFLKGIKKSEEIYEVYNRKITKPKPPRGKKERSINPVLIFGSIAFLLMITASIFLIPKFFRNSDQVVENIPSEVQIKEVKNENTIHENVEEAEGTDIVENIQPAETLSVEPEVLEEVSIIFSGLYAIEPILDYTTKLLVVEYEGNSDLKTHLVDIQPGKHIIHFDIANMVRNYAEFIAEPGEQIVQLKFVECRLPNVRVNQTVGDKGKESSDFSSEGNYIFFNRSSLEAVEFNCTISGDVDGVVKDDSTIFEIDYEIEINSEIIKKDSFEVISPMGNDQLTRVDEITLFQDEYHIYTMKYHYRNDSIQFQIDSMFVEYQ